MDAVAAHLVRHDFKALFVEVLGWDHATAEHRFEADGLSFTFRLIAHKRGFQILVCETDRYTLFNRRRLRTLQRQLLKFAHEHIVIYSCDEPRKQVWQWAVHLPDGHRLRHREHPFFSRSPPDALASRLTGLRFTLAEEERITLVDALDRVRSALDTRAELDLFVIKPWYAEKSDRLAMAMRAGGLAEFNAFVLFHRRLAKWGTKRLTRWFGMDEEDAEQTGMIAVLRAARGFKPELGFQFSTYATRAIHMDCHRLGPDAAFLIRIPAGWYWWYVSLRRASERLDARFGSSSGARFLKRLAERNVEFRRRWPGFRAATEVRSLSDPREPEYREARLLPALDGNPAAEVLHTSMLSEVLASAIDALPPDDARLIRLRYGLDGERQTLKAIGQPFRVTKERIRQRQLKIEDTLRRTILNMLGDPTETRAGGEAAPAGTEQSTGDAALPGVEVATGSPAGEESDHAVQRPPEEPPEVLVLRPEHRVVQGGLFAHAR